MTEEQTDSLEAEAHACTGPVGLLANHVVIVPDGHLEHDDVVANQLVWAHKFHAGLVSRVLLFGVVDMVEWDTLSINQLQLI